VPLAIIAAAAMPTMVPTSAPLLRASERDGTSAIASPIIPTRKIETALRKYIAVLSISPPANVY
jgi:hypothetical protein